MATKTVHLGNNGPEMVSATAMVVGKVTDPVEDESIHVTDVVRRPSESVVTMLLGIEVTKVVGIVVLVVRNCAEYDKELEGGKFGGTYAPLLVEAGKFGGIYAPLLPAEGIMVMGEVKTVEPLREPGR